MKTRYLEHWKKKKSKESLSKTEIKSKGEDNVKLNARKKDKKGAHSAKSEIIITSKETKSENYELMELLKSNNLYDELFDILNGNDVDLETLQLVRTNEIDEFCEEYQITKFKTKLCFRKLMKIIHSKQMNMNNQQYEQQTVREDKKEKIRNKKDERANNKPKKEKYAKNRKKPRKKVVDRHID